MDKILISINFLILIIKHKIKVEQAEIFPNN